MKKLLTILPLLLLTIGVYAQTLSQVTLSQAGSFAYFTFLSDRDIQIRISAEGQILEFGTEAPTGNNNNYYAPRLLPYTGRVEYYGNEADSAFRGKIRVIGSTAITYYGGYEVAYKKGKIKTIGSQLLDYYSNTDNAVLQGKLRSIGRANVEFYSSFDDEALRGKLKSLDYTPIAYYTSFDDKLIRGKIKSIGSANYSWYSSYDQQGLRGSLKSGAPRQTINGITYNLW
jgi:hypothetical protein